MSGRVYCVVPTYRPVGGVIKLFDYARHLLDLGREPVIVSSEPYRPDSPLFDIARFAPLARDAGVLHLADTGFGIENGDLVLFSWPDQYDTIAERLPPTFAHGRVIHLVQNTRHANAAFAGGYARRLLTRPMTRISTNEFVADAIRPFAHPASLHEVVPIGHDVGFFWTERNSGIDRERPLRVAYTTWKSRLGDELAATTAGRGTFAFRRLTHEVAWGDLRDLYRWADVFVGAPLPEEGTYLPGLEAMAAGAIVVMPDVGGNRTYASFGETCLEANFGEAGSYLAALEQVRMMTASEIDALRHAAHAAARRHSLDEEQAALAAALERIEDDVAPRSPHPGAAAALRSAIREGWE